LPAVLAEFPEHARRAIDAPVATPRIDASSFVPGPAITDGRNLDGRAALVDELLRLMLSTAPCGPSSPAGASSRHRSAYDCSRAVATLE